MGDYDMTTDIYIFASVLQSFERGPGDLTGIPPEASLYCSEIWAIMGKETGGEASLIYGMGVKDVRVS